MITLEQHIVGEYRIFVAVDSMISHFSAKDRICICGKKSPVAILIKSVHQPDKWFFLDDSNITQEQLEMEFAEQLGQSF